MGDYPRGEVAGPQFNYAVTGSGLALQQVTLKLSQDDFTSQKRGQYRMALTQAHFCYAIRVREQFPLI